jgi:hypothetical protein
MKINMREKHLTSSLFPPLKVKGGEGLPAGRQGCYEYEKGVFIIKSLSPS